MKTGRIDYTDFIDRGERAVLDALDAFLQDELELEKARGWRDQDLPQLLPAVRAHLAAVAARFNAPDSTEPGSAFVKFFDM